MTMANESKKEGTGYTPTSISDPIRCWLPEDVEAPPSGSGWYFYDECWIKLYGPFQSKLECDGALINYANTL